MIEAEQRRNAEQKQKAGQRHNAEQKQNVGQQHEAGQRQHHVDKRKTFLRQSIRYVITGLSSVALEFILFLCLYQLLAVEVIISNIIAITLASIFNFLMSRTYTFSSSSSLPRSIVLYLLLFIWNQTFSSWALVSLIGAGFAAPVAKLVTMCCIVIWNFFLYRKVVFK